MRYLFTARESKILDEHAIQVVGFPSVVLMEKAAMTLASVVIEREKAGTGVLVVCGTGNNGGDGLAVARLLHQQGFAAAVVLAGDSEKMTTDARTQLVLAAACGVPVVPAGELSSPVYDVIIDGLFGVGLSRDVTGAYAKLIEDINASGKRVYAVDIPSGVSGDDGRIMNVAVRADVTVTFGVNKRGLVLYPGCECAGEVIVGDIGYPGASYEAVSNPAHYFEPDDLKRILPVRRPDGHKGTFGKVTVIGGSDGMCGAPLFSARAAYLSGAGLVRICSSSRNREILLSGVPEALFTPYDDEDRRIDFAAIDAVIEYGDCLVLGPGLGTDDRAAQITSYVLEHCDKPLILDGDGITLSDREMISGRGTRILTPHVKEFSRIAGKDIALLKEDFLREVSDFAAETGCILVGKDARTAVSDGRELYINVSGNSGMGTAGSGDVLTGIIAGLLAQGTEPYLAARAGVYLHGLAGDHYASKYNTYSLTATGLLESIPSVMEK